MSINVPETSAIVHVLHEKRLNTVYTNMDIVFVRFLELLFCFELLPGTVLSISTITLDFTLLFMF